MVVGLEMKDECDLSTVSVSLPCSWKMSEPFKAIVIRVTEIKLHVLRENCYKVNLKYFTSSKFQVLGRCE
jgi:hypothetical protein